jgi:uncharacterized protein involved in outer membrane biogenesis
VVNKRRRILLILAVPIGLIVLAMVGVGWNVLKGPLVWVVSHETGRRFAITGDLHVTLSRQPKITADGVVLGNVPGATNSEMAEIDRVSARVDVRELLRGKLVLPELALSRPRIRLETSADGRANWDFGTATGSTPGTRGAPRPHIGAIRIDRGTVVYRDPTAGTDVEMAVSTAASAPPAEQVIIGHVQGRVAGQRFSIGRLEATLGPVLRLTADDVVVTNAPWGTRPSLAEIRQAVVTIDPESLRNGRLALPEVILSRPDVLLERSGDGRWNWDFGPGSGAGEAPRLGAVVIRSGRFGYRDPRTRTDVWIDVATATPRPGDAQPMMAVKGGGRYKGARFELGGRVGTLLSLRDSTHPYPVDLTTRVGETRAVVTGGLVAPQELRGIQVNLQLEGPDLSQLYPFIPVPLPVTPAYRVAGHLDHVGKTWTFSRFTGRVGDSDLAGDFSVDLGGDRPVMHGDLVSRTLVLHDLAGLVGARPDTEPTAAEARRPAVQPARSDRVLPDAPYRLDRLRAADATIRFRGQHVISALPLDHVTADLVLRDGQLRLTPLDLGVAGGRIRSAITMNGRQSPMATAVNLDVEGLELKRLFPGLQLKVGSAGRIGGQAQLAGRGDSVAAMLGSANGRLVLGMSGGRISKLVLNLADVDVGGSLLALLSDGPEIPVDCMVADFLAEDGRMEAKTLMLETPHTTLSGKGTIDFADETLDLRLTAHSKRPSLVVLRGPIDVTGRFKAPHVRPDPVPMSLRAAAAAALGVLFPPAAILPFVELGVSPDRDCSTSIARAGRPPTTSRAEAAGTSGS